MLAETSPLPAVRSEPIATYAAQRPSSPPPSKTLHHVPVDDSRHFGAPFCAPERGAAPHPPGDELERRVAIYCPAPATPMMMLSPQPLWQHSSAVRITSMFPMHSNK